MKSHVLLSFIVATFFLIARSAYSTESEGYYRGDCSCVYIAIENDDVTTYYCRGLDDNAGKNYYKYEYKLDLNTYVPTASFSDVSKLGEVELEIYKGRLDTLYQTHLENWKN